MGLAQGRESRVVQTAREPGEAEQADPSMNTPLLLCVYNGHDYPFDLNDLRAALGTRLAKACLDYLNYDRLGIKEVRRHLSGGDRELHDWAVDDLADKYRQRSGA
jgi:hypothetical protein